MFCSNCGMEVASSYKMCPKCGGKNFGGTTPHNFSGSPSAIKPVGAKPKGEAGGFFSMKGRLNRARYFRRILIPWLLSIICAFAALAVHGFRGDFISPSLFDGPWILFCVIIAFEDVKRLHDLDRPGWHFWLLLIPLYNIYLQGLLFFKKGTEGENNYGPDPLGD